MLACTFMTMRAGKQEFKGGRELMGTIKHEINKLGKCTYVYIYIYIYIHSKETTMHM